MKISISGTFSRDHFSSRSVPVPSPSRDRHTVTNYLKH